MTHLAPTRSLCATAAVAAVLALGSTPAAAQEAAPSLDLPEAVTPPSESAPAPGTPTVVLPSTTTPAAPTATTTAPSSEMQSPVRPGQPTIVLPDVSGPAQTPRSSAAPSVPTPSESIRAESPRPDGEPAANAASASAPGSADPAPVREAQNDSAAGAIPPIDEFAGDGAAPIDATQRVAAPIADASPELAPAAEPAEDGDGMPAAAIAGLLALLGIGGAGMMAMRSRRRSSHVVHAKPATIPARTPDPAPRPAAAALEPAAPAPASRGDAAYTTGRPEVANQFAAAGVTEAPVLERETPVARTAPPARVRVDPDGPLPTGEARQELLRSMVAAEPDEANPFRSPKARRRRARVILQHREHMQRHHPDNRFDWRTYRPTTKPSTPVNPSMVPA
ncbi:hypothetical protein B2G71_00815 [Novosphingobium sp. PC22D]|uniref:hypothetical protein n=1 Tax=Novosphingobium sp. PC22D TaxID=1962403 RepID=UPI000BEF25A0|nr:hypothetical protein [Novosphingobium sp. PC22D]PEQ14184.1 hypothetical protein B2G71_00815 [Novosphingobium sp. PC22D]